MELVGRRREIAEFERLLGQAQDGHGGLLVVTGPPGSGKTALIDAAGDEARRRRFAVVRGTPAPGQPPRLVWARLLRDLDAAESLVAAVMAADTALDLDAAIRVLVTGGPRLVLIDDIDRSADAADPLAVVAARAAGTRTAVIVTATRSLGLGPEIVLRPLPAADIAAIAGPLDPGACRVLWRASQGWPGPALRLAAELAGASDDPVVHLALHRASEAAFLEVDFTLVTLLEAALARRVEDATRARLLARLARELLGDASAGARRRVLIDEASALAYASGSDQALGEVLDARLHALWDPAGAHDRLAAAAEIIRLAQASGDGVRERRGLFWRFAALMELARIGEAESALAAYQRAATAAGDPEASAVVTARQAMLAAIRGHFGEARRLTGEFAVTGERIGLADTGRLARTLYAAIAVEQGTLGTIPGSAEDLFAFARAQLGHLYEATAAFVLALSGREREAAAELDRVLPRALAASGPRWLAAMAELAVVAAVCHDTAAARAVYEAMLPYRGRLVVRGGANASLGPVSRFLGLLAVELGALDDAVALLEDAAGLEEEIGALPGLANTLVLLASACQRRGSPADAARAAGYRRRARTIADRLELTLLAERFTSKTDEWRLRRDGEDWVLEAGDEHVRFRDSRGLHYLRSLLAAPGQEIPALDLVAGGAGLAAAPADPVLDAQAQAAYRRRLAQLEAALDAADRAGDRGRAARAEAEREALVAELRRATGLGGRHRVLSADAERARVNVTRTLRATIERILLSAPRAGAHLQCSVHTGRACRYQPEPGGPTRWQT